MNGIIFNIQRFSVHDGPGIRTNIFLKGCPLHCEWCCNPESQSVFPQPLYDAQRCIGCGSCAAACTLGAIRITDNYRIDYTKCQTCADHPCVSRCFAEALSLAGEARSVEQIMGEIRQDIPFYRSSGGGVTFSGGEATMQMDFLLELLRQCREEGISTALETCSAVRWEDLQKTLPYLDLYLCDVKHTDPEKLKAETGGSAELILGNIRRLAQAGAHVIGRVPVIPEFNSSQEEIRAIGQFLLNAGISEVNLLPYHRLGVPKYCKLFSPHVPKERRSLDDAEIQSLVRLLLDMGLVASIG